MRAATNWLIADAVACLLVGCTSHAESTPVAPGALEIEIDDFSSCVDFTERGQLEKEVRSDLLAQVMADSELDRNDYFFYKSVSTPVAGLRYYLFGFRNMTDIYRVYLMDEAKSRMRAKFYQGSLHYPPDFTTCTYPGLPGIRRNA